MPTNQHSTQKSNRTDQAFQSGAVSRRRLLLFKVIAALIPLLGVVLLEGILRLFGYGHDLSLFVEDPQRKGYWVMNRYVSERYFSETANATLGNYEPFYQHKPAGTVRLFVLGESTTIGYPYFHNGSFHRWLQYRLMHSYPDTNFEIINVSLTAVNSYTVFGFAKEVLNYEPDAVLIYTGHNEYYGALGVGSTSFIAQSSQWVRFVLSLRDFRVVQLVNHLFARIRQAASGKQVDVRENLMKRMAADQQIAYGSPSYQRGIDQFEANLSDLCERFSKRGVPLFISNLVSNEKDLKPFVSAPENAANSAQKQYKSASQALAKGQFDLAKKGFVQAKEFDLLRFRAPEAINQIIRDLATRYPGVTLVDAKAAFERQSPHGILGKETLLEHVHPNLYGYALLSDAFYEALKQKGLPTTGRKAELSFAELRQRMPITAVDSLKGAYEVMMLKEGWPFNEPMPAETKRTKTTEEQLAGALAVKQLSWPQAMDNLLQHYLKTTNQLDALRVCEGLVLEYPYNPVYYEQAGKLSMNLTNNELAGLYLKKAFDLAPKFETAQNLFITLLKQDKPEEALTYLRYAATHNEGRINLNELQSFVEQLVAVKKQYLTDTANVNLSNQLAAGYLKFANVAGASKYIEKTLRIDSRNPVALALKQQVLNLQK